MCTHHTKWTSVFNYFSGINLGFNFTREKKSRALRFHQLRTTKSPKKVFFVMCSVRSRFEPTGLGWERLVEQRWK